MHTIEIEVPDGVFLEAAELADNRTRGGHVEHGKKGQRVCSDGCVLTGYVQHLDISWAGLGCGQGGRRRGRWRGGDGECPAGVGAGHGRSRAACKN